MTTTTNKLTATVPPCLVWMLRDFGDVDLETPQGDDDDDSQAYLEAHAAMKAVPREPETDEREEPFSLDLSRDAWIALLDEMEMLNDRDVYQDNDTDQRRFRAHKRAERRELNRLYKALGITQDEVL